MGRILAAFAEDGGAPDLSSLGVNLVCVVAISLSIMSVIIFSCADHGSKQPDEEEGKGKRKFCESCCDIFGRCCQGVADVCGNGDAGGGGTDGGGGGHGGGHHVDAGGHGSACGGGGGGHGSACGGGGGGGS